MNGQPGAPRSADAGAGGFLARMAARAQGGSEWGRLRPRPLSRFEQIRDEREATVPARLAGPDTLADPGLPPDDARALPGEDQPLAGQPPAWPPRMPGPAGRPTGAGAEAGDATDAQRVDPGGRRPDASGARSEAVGAASSGAAPIAAMPAAGAVAPHHRRPLGTASTEGPGGMPDGPDGLDDRSANEQSRDVLGESGGPRPASRSGRGPVEARGPQLPAPAPAADAGTSHDRADRSVQRAGAVRRPVAAPPPAAPVVHVTIGRIEVRAVPATPAAPERSRPAEPAVATLDQYLRRRARSRG